MKLTKIAISLFLAVVLVLYINSTKNQTGTTTDDSDATRMEKSADRMEKPAEKNEATDTTVESESSMVETEAVQLNMSNFTFGVDEIEVEVGEELVVMVTNDSGVHDFVIDELDVNTGLVPQGETVKVVIPTDKPGTYEYYCSVGKHRELGMKGTLIVR